MVHTTKILDIQPAECRKQKQVAIRGRERTKYICRHSQKGGIQDIEKAIHYLEMVKERDYSVRSKHEQPLFTPETEWVMPDELKDLREDHREVAIRLRNQRPTAKSISDLAMT